MSRSRLPRFAVSTLLPLLTAVLLGSCDEPPPTQPAGGDGATSGVPSVKRGPGDVDEVVKKPPSLPEGVRATISGTPPGLVTEDLDGPLTPTDLAEALMGTGIGVSNVSYTGADVAAGTFTGGAGIINGIFERGVVLSTGDIANVIGPNDFSGVTVNHGNPGDDDLDGLIAPGSTFDAAVLTFEFVPTGSQVTFDYVFASEEYNEFVKTSFNDVFGLFVNGTNCATVGSPPGPVSVNNINNGNPFGTTPNSNPGLFQNNEVASGGGSIDTEMDGLTVVLTCTAPVTPDDVNTLKVAIADGGDRSLDGAVFIDVGGEIQVTVEDAGTPVDGRVVTAVNSQDGPFTLQGAPATALTNADGVARLRGLALDAGYCVHTRGLTSVADATGQGDGVVPLQDSEGNQPDPPDADASAISGPNGAVAFTNPNYVQHCIDSPPITLNASNPVASVTLDLDDVGPPATLTGDFQDLEGADLPLPVWAVIDKSGEIPWFPSTLDPDIKPGLLAMAVPPTGSFELTGLPPGIDLVLESGIADRGAQGFLTFTRGAASPETAGDEEDLGTLQLEPLMCSIDRQEERDDDGKKGGRGRGRGAEAIEFLGPVKSGFRATAPPAFDPILHQVGVFYDQAGSGRAQLHMRFHTTASGDAFNLLARYACDGNGCSPGKVNGSAADAGVVPKLFSADQGDDVRRITWSIEELDLLPGTLTAVEFRLQTAGDDAPDPPRAGSQRGFVGVDIPTACTGGQSNDDRWWVLN